MSEINKMLGQLFLIGFKGEEPSKEFLNFISEENIGGVILFADNCKSAKSLKKTIKQIKEATTSYPFIAIDQEGGRVCRIQGKPAQILSAAEYGEKYNVEKYSEDYNRSLIYMDSLGINLNLAPVCDLFLKENNTCLKDRCFGSDIQKVVPFITESIKCAKRNNFLSCLKHFPGLGDTEIDPHVKTAEGSYDQYIWSQREKLVFEAGIKAGSDMLMTTHLLLPKFSDTIVTGSFDIINKLIRKDLAFDSVVITDDLTMKGADILGDFGERTVKAFQAGHDILLFGQNLDASIEAYEYFRSAVDKGEITQNQIEISLERITGLKFKIAQSVFT